MVKQYASTNKNQRMEGKMKNKAGVGSFVLGLTTDGKKVMGVVTLKNEGLTMIVDMRTHNRVPVCNFLRVIPNKQLSAEQQKFVQQQCRNL